MANYTAEQALTAYNNAEIRRMDKHGEHTYFNWVEGTKQESVALDTTELSYTATDQEVKDTFIQWLQDNCPYKSSEASVEEQIVGKV